MTQYTAAANRYEQIAYKQCGKSGLKLPIISLGLWHNFGDVDTFDNYRKIVHKAFDSGITHFDLANNYGPPPGSAETNFGKIFHKDLMPYRDEIIISTKAGYTMWDGPYGDWGSKKYLVSSLDQSLKRMKLEYVDIFYHHRPDPNTPLEETAHTLDLIVKQGKALYVGVSNYKPEETRKIAELLKQTNTPFIIHQPRYSMLDRCVEDGLLDTLEETGLGSIVFSPLAQGLLTDKYLKGIPQDSRAAKSHGHLQESALTPEMLSKLQKLNTLAKKRNQSLAQMAISWLLKDPRVTSVLIGASSVSQLENNLEALHNLVFLKDELKEIEEILR